MPSPQANDVYSDSPNPGRALAIPLPASEKGASFNLLRTEVITDCSEEVAGEERAGSRKDWLQVSPGRLPISFQGVPPVLLLKITGRFAESSERQLCPS